MKPNLLIAGAQKAGTTWLHRMLEHHPDIAMSAKKELNNLRLPEASFRARWEEYLAHWEGRTERWRGESTPHYFWDARPPYGPQGVPDVARRVRDELDDDTVVLVLLRDPVSRAVSGYWHNFSRQRLDPQTTSLFRTPPEMGVIDLGFYRRHHEHWVDTLGAGRVKVLLYDDLVADPEGFVVSALEAIGAPTDVPEFWAAIDVNARIHDKSWVKEYRAANNPITAIEVAALLDLYRDDIDYVEQVTGRDLAAWRDRDALVAKHARA
jgi:hypothetical protein